MRATAKRIIVLIVLISVILISCSSVDPIQDEDTPVPTEVTSTQQKSSGEEIETQSGFILKLIGEIGNTNIYKFSQFGQLITSFSTSSHNCGLREGLGGNINMVLTCELIIQPMIGGSGIPSIYSSCARSLATLQILPERTLPGRAAS